MENKFLSIENISQYLGVKPSTIYAMVHSGALPHYRVGRLIRFKLADVDSWMEKHRHGDTVTAQAKKCQTKHTRQIGRDIDGIIRKAIDGVNVTDYTLISRESDRIKGLGKEA